MNVAAKWVGSAIFVPVLAVGIYIGAVVQVYLLAWVLEFIGRIL